MATFTTDETLPAASAGKPYAKWAPNGLPAFHSIDSEMASRQGIMAARSPASRFPPSLTMNTVPSEDTQDTRDTDHDQSSASNSDSADLSGSESSSLGPPSVSSMPLQDFHRVPPRSFPPLMPGTRRGLTSQASSHPTLDLRLRQRPPIFQIKPDNDADSLYVSSVSDDTDYEPAASSSSSHTRVTAVWAKLQAIRENMGHAREQMAEKRRKLRELRRRREIAENDFMAVLRPMLASGTRSGIRPRPGLDNLISNRFKEMQTIRDDYSTIETEYENLESTMESEENELLVCETQYFSLLYGFDRRREIDQSSEQSELEAIGTPSRASLLGISAERPVDVHPLYRHLLDAVGDRELAREHHSDLLRYREGLLFDLERKIKVDKTRDAKSGPGMSEEELDLLKQRISTMSPEEMEMAFGAILSKDDAEFLRNYEDDEGQARKRLNGIRNEVEQLRSLCINKGIVSDITKGPLREDIDYRNYYTIFSDVVDGSIFESGNMTINHDAMPKSGTDLANPRFPILLSNPKYVLSELTAKGAVREATRIPTEDPTRLREIGEAMKEYGIATLVEQCSGEDKSDFINRWLLHRLRISPLEAELLFTVFTTKLKVINIQRWQEDVLYFWPRDEGNTSPDIYTGPLTSREDLQVSPGGGTTDSNLINSEKPDALTTAASEDGKVENGAITYDNPTPSTVSLEVNADTPHSEDA